MSLLGWEEQERARRSLERRLRTAHIGRFKVLCDFDWAGPTRCDRAAVNPVPPTTPGWTRRRLTGRAGPPGATKLAQRFEAPKTDVCPGGLATTDAQ
jgi:hypothetical protein